MRSWQSIFRRVAPCGLYTAAMTIFSLLHFPPMARATPAQGTRVIVQGPYSANLAIPLGLNDAISVSAGQYFTLALRANGTVIAWGDNSQGQTNVPPGLSNVVAISAGAAFSVALRADYSVVGWGANGGGALPIPASVTNVAQVVASGSAGLALRRDGSLVQWGFSQQPLPANLGDVVKIAGKYGHFVAFRRDGTVISWGTAYLGLNIPPAAATNVVFVGAGSWHNVTLRQDDLMVGWGDNQNYQTVAPPNATNLVMIDGGSSGNIALRSDGAAVTWGYYIDADVPAVITKYGKIFCVASGQDHIVMLAANGRPQIGTVLAPVAPIAGSPAHLRVAAGGAAALQFQWRRNGQIIEGATSPELFIPAVTTSDSGSYQVEVKNNVGVALSKPVEMTVMPARIIAAPKPQTAVLFTPVEFNVTVDSSAAVSYQWLRDGSPIRAARPRACRFQR